ncbi:MAG: hypothetical protein J6I64_07385 [Lachnospiraceae bacterium]|nr:hypothetical protein [Lachnospiraceae bacterium]
MFARIVECNLVGKKAHLAYTVGAMFDINDILGERDLFDVLKQNNKESYGDFCAILAVLAENGEKCRREAGLEKKPYPTKEALAAGMSPAEYLEARHKILDAIMLGLKREVVREDEEIDLGLAELEKK